LVPHAHAQLATSAPCTYAQLGASVPLVMHTWTQLIVPMHTSRASAPCANTLCSCICQDGLHYCVEGCFRLEKKGQSMPRHLAAINHKNSAIIIGVDFLTCVGHVPLFVPRTTHGPTKKGMHAEWMWPNARGCLQPHVPALG
jgi:hypothetical protein